MSYYEFEAIRGSLLSLQLLDDHQPYDSGDVDFRVVSSSGPSIEISPQTTIYKNQQTQVLAQSKVCEVQQTINCNQNHDQSARLEQSKVNHPILDKKKEIPNNDETDLVEEHSRDNKRFLIDLNSDNGVQSNSSQYAENIKHNFEVLLQKVYNIIEQIEHRNEDSQISVSKRSNQGKLSARRQLSLSARVVELSVGKGNGELKKKFRAHQTDYDFQNQQQNVNHTESHFTTQTKTPKRVLFQSMAGIKPIDLNPRKLLHQERQTGTDSIKSRKNSKSNGKGLSLVSKQKNLKKEENEKKSVKITLVQTSKCSGKRNEQNMKTEVKVDKKTSFNPSNFFSSRRVSTRLI